MLQTMESPLAPAQLQDIPHITNWARDTGPRMNPTLQKVLEALSRYASEDGYANPFQEQLLEHVDCSISTLKRALKDLEGLRIITITEERWAHDGRRNLYRLSGVHNGWVPRPRDLQQKASVVNAAYKLIEERDAWISELEEQLTGFGWSKGNELTAPVVEGQISTGQIDPTEEEEELSGQNELDETSSSSSSQSSGQPSGEASKEGANLTPITSPGQPYLYVETDEPLDQAVEGPSIEDEIKDWVMANWRRTTWHAPGPAIAQYLADHAKYQLDRLTYEEKWRSNDEIRTLVDGREPAPKDPGEPAVLQTPAEPAPPLPEVVVEREAWDLWVQVIAVLHERLPEQIFSSWVRNTFGASIVGGHVEGAPRIFQVGCPTAFAVTWLERRMYEDVRQAILEVSGESMEVHFLAAVFGTLPWWNEEPAS